jgi:hypothetical protein
MKTEMTRKEFLHVAFLGLAAGAGATLLASCGGKEEAQTTAQKPATKPVSADPCADVSSLTQPELTMRSQTLKYVAHSTEAGKSCETCKFWTPPEGEEICGGCTLIKGPINPKGYCTSWFTRET